MLLEKQIIIFEEFLRDFNAKLTGSYIARKKGLNQKTTANILNQLEKNKILVSETQGKNKLFYLNLNNKIVIENFIIAVEHIRTINFYKNNILIKEIAQKIQSHIKGVAIIFGSYAKNTQKKNSDLDLLIIGQCNEKEIENISKTYRIEINMKIYPDLETDILLKEVIKDHIIIKNTEQFIIKWEELNGV